MSLGAPWMLLLLPLVALAAWLMVRARRLQHESACQLKGVAPEAVRARLGRRDWLKLAALLCIVLALARPEWNPRRYDQQRRARDLVIALDVSRSMLAADVLPSRLEMARIAIHEALPALTGQRVALVTFAGSASVRVPLTLDHEFVRYMLERADPSDMDMGSTSLQAAFDKAASAVLTDAAGGRDLVVFTDGEDHLSNLEETADLLAQCGAQVLIIGLGDPVRGERVPDAGADDGWMQYDSAAVVSRLEESTLEKLSDNSPNVTYYPARTRPFNLVTLYRNWIAGAGDDIVVGGLRTVRYDQGYPYLLALAVVLWLASSPRKLPALRNLLMLSVLLLPGCARRADDAEEAAFRARFLQGSELLEHAEAQSDLDSFAERSLLLDSREEFLCAALLKSGDLETARQITSITQRLRKVEAVIEEQRVAEERRQETLAEIVERLRKLSVRQEGLSHQSSQVLRRLRIPRELDPNDSGNYANEYANEDNAPLDGGSGNERRATRLARAEQQNVREATASILDGITFQQDTLRQILTRAYGDVGRPPTTELDVVVELLAEVLDAQDQAVNSLGDQSLDWPRANTAFHIASARMQQTLESLRALLPPKKAEDESMPPRNDRGNDEGEEGLDPEGADNKPQPVSAGDFQAALSLQSLPVPNYTSAEIMAEEAANQQQRARRKAARAGARVEKNW